MSTKLHISWNKNVKNIPAIHASTRDLKNHFFHHVIQSVTQFVQMGRESETRFSYQSERSTFGRGSFGL